MAKSPDQILKELEMLTEEIKEKTSNKTTKRKKTQKAKSKSKEEPAVTKELRRSLELLEKEVFIKIDDPVSIARDLIHSKKVVKSITTTLMALTKVNKVREELVDNLNKNINDLKNIVHSLEQNLNVEHYQNSIKSPSMETFSEYIDTIENDIEEIRRNIGLAK